MQVRTALDAAEALVAALDIRYGEVCLRVSDAGLVLLRKGETIMPDVLAEMMLDDDDDVESHLN